MTTQTIELSHWGIRVYPVPYTEYTQLRKEELQKEWALHEGRQAKMARSREFIRRNIAG
ncbi:hypothetical protein [Pajaroellobacter abortibovis]|uniref:hypothetical protein n=1 Tax=Pajaroellobacter abortibovis TaxID=1882918 RepID=UPI001FE3CFA4|nr:hypothetical protein [Pajaroellobacter abortibovis]